VAFPTTIPTTYAPGSKETLSAERKGMHPTNLWKFGVSIADASRAANTQDSSALEQANAEVFKWADELLRDDPILYTTAWVYLAELFNTDPVLPIKLKTQEIKAKLSERLKQFTPDPMSGYREADWREQKTATLGKQLHLEAWPAILKDTNAFGKDDVQLRQELAVAMRRDVSEIPAAALDAVRVVSYRNNTHNMVLTARGYSVDEVLGGRLGATVDLTKVNIRASDRELDAKLPALMQKFGYPPDDKVRVKSAILQNREALLINRTAQ
jgi:hypothetical protein